MSRHQTLRQERDNPPSATVYLRVTMVNAFGQDVAIMTMPVEWAACELDTVFPPGFSARLAIPNPANPQVMWSLRIEHES